MKKIVSLLIALALVVSCASVVALAAGNPVVTVSGGTGEVGGQVTVSFSVSKALLGFYECVIDYDASALELVSIEGGSIIADSFKGNVEKAKVVGLSEKDAEVEGVLFTATFNVLASGDHTVTLVDCYFGNIDEDIDVSVNAGVISVAAAPCAPGEHELEWHQEERGNCGEPAVKEYYSCVACGMLFADEEGTVEVTEEELTFIAEHLFVDMQWWDEATEAPYLATVCQYCYEIKGEMIPLNELNAGDCPTEITIGAGETVAYNASGFGGFTMVIRGENLVVEVLPSRMSMVTEPITYVSKNGVVEIPISVYNVMMKITNKGAAGTFPVEVVIPVGDQMNPAALNYGSNSFALPEGLDMGYYTVITPDHSGTMTITVGGTDYWSFDIFIDNDPEDWSDTYYGARHDACEGDSNSETVEVKAGYPVVVHIGTYNSEDWSYPAGTVTVNVEFVPTHTVEHVDAVAPTCETEGNIEYWYCTECGIAWQDEALTQITNLKNVILPPAHNVEHVEAVEPGCESEGNIEYWYCTLCGAAWQDEAQLQVTNLKNVILPATHKNIIHMEAVEPGCHYIGHVEHWYCADCDMLWIDEDMLQISNHKAVILPALGSENVEAVPAREPDCTNPGHVAYWHCPDCDQYWTDEALTQLTNRLNLFTEAAKGHTYDDDKDMICNVCEFDRTNSQTGDFGIIAAVASAIISLTGIVALPVAKKKFF